MSKKYNYIKQAIFYANEKPDMLASLLEGVVSDVVVKTELFGADSIEIPTGDTPNTSTYTAKAFSQFGDEMTTPPTITLKASVTGVSISDGVVSVANTATAESFTLVATSGSVTSEKVVALAVVNA